MKKGKLSTIFFTLAAIFGLSLLLYPSISDWWNSTVQSGVVDNYQAKVKKLDEDEYNRLWESARAYNKRLTEDNNGFFLSKEQLDEYKSSLNISGDGVMGYVEISVINCMLPVYHGTDDALSIAAEHLEWSSLPVGGESTHCVISGHRGLPTATLFTNLDKMIVGDLFVLHVLNEELTYEVDQIRVVEPKETNDLRIEQGKDLVTLVTCTPYGINSHRLLIRGHRVDNVEAAKKVRITSDAVKVDRLLVSAILVVPIIIIMFTAISIFEKIKKRRNISIKRSGENEKQL
ncbi:MAG: class C sortase [Acutalibacteraceae bacterium]|nr:class C sortase [Acutalibacteraceae bacterium]